jgi:hypothetical protein
MPLSLKKILILSISFLIIVPAYSQFKLGLHAGIGYSNYRGKDFSDENTPKFGIVGGFYFEREINMTFSLGFELNDEQKGTNYNYYPRIATNISVDSRLEYISLPILMKAYVGQNANYYFYTGVSGAYLISSSNQVSGTEYGYTVTWETFFDYQFRKYDAAILLGFGLNFREIILDFRYQYGIVDIYKGNNPPSIKNSLISVTLGYSIYKKKVKSCFNPNRKH